jgi:hypothetical protein
LQKSRKFANFGTSKQNFNGEKKLNQQQVLQHKQLPPLTPDEYGIYRKMLYINKTTLNKVTIYDFQSEFYDIITGTTYRAIKNIKYLKKILFNLRHKGYSISSSKQTKPQGYYTKEYEHLVTLDMTYTDFPSQLGNSSSTYQEPRDIGELLQFGIHDILFCPRVKGSHKKFLDYGLKQNIKKNIKVGKFTINKLKFIVRSSNQDTLMIHVATSKNQIMLNNQSHIELFDKSLDELIIKLSTIYGIDNIYHHDNWIIKMWHVAADFNEASEERFHVTWKDAKGIFNRKYSKLLPSQNTNTRIETQQLPNLTKKLALAAQRYTNNADDSNFNNIHHKPY